MYSDSIKTNILDDEYLQVSFTVDTKVNCNIRISICVTEEVNQSNTPTMFFTKNQKDYVKVLNMMAGMKQEIMFGEINFPLDKISDQEMLT